MSRHLDPANAGAIREALTNVRAAMQSWDSDACDAADIEELIDKSAAELDTHRPNAATLSTYLNSIARSLRAETRTRSLVTQLDAAMRAAKVPTTWEQ